MSDDEELATLARETIRRLVVPAGMAPELGDRLVQDCFVKWRRDPDRRDLEPIMSTFTGLVLQRSPWPDYEDAAEEYARTLEGAAI